MVPESAIELFKNLPIHPLARTSPPGGALGMANGDIVQFVNGRPVRMDEALQDGDALCTLADGSHTILKWNLLRAWR